MYLSKTDFREYLHCPKCLWLKKNEPDLYVKEIATEFDLKLINEGFEVELAARKPYQKGILVQGSNEETAARTLELIKSKTSPFFRQPLSQSQVFWPRPML